MLGPLVAVGQSSWPSPCLSVFWDVPGSGAGCSSTWSHAAACSVVLGLLNKQATCFCLISAQQLVLNSFCVCLESRQRGCLVSAARVSAGHCSTQLRVLGKVSQAGLSLQLYIASSELSDKATNQLRCAEGREGRSQSLKRTQKLGFSMFQSTALSLEAALITIILFTQQRQVNLQTLSLGFPEFPSGMFFLPSQLCTVQLSIIFRRIG